MRRVLNDRTSASASIYWLAAIVALAAFCTPAHAALQVSQITPDNAAQLVRKGPDATGGVGDWFISNGVVCAVISDLLHEGEFSASGGTLIDLGYCGRADDHYTNSQDLMTSPANPVNIEHIELAQGPDWVAILTQGTNQGIKVETRYELNMTHLSQLAISKKISVVEQEHLEFSFYTPFWFNYRSLESFVFSSQDVKQNKGFSNVDFVTRGAGAIRDATHNADTLILLSPPEANYPIAYGWQVKSAHRVNAKERYPLPRFFLSDEESAALFLMTDSFYIGDGSQIGWLQLPQIPLLSLNQPDYIELEEVLIVGQRADTASITDQLFTASWPVSAQLSELNSALHIELKDGTPVTFVRPQADGVIEFRLPAGEYRVRHVGTANREQHHDLIVSQKAASLGRLTLPVPARLMLPKGHAMRLVFQGQGDTLDPDFDDRLTGFSVHDGETNEVRDKVSQVFLAGVDSDPESVDLAPGRYQVFATAGPEYSLTKAIVTIESGESKTLKIDIPKQVIQTPGYIAADFHVHSGLSFDNTFATDRRVRTFVAEHGEVMVSSEHDLPTDYSPMIEALGVQDKITSINAVEMTSIFESEMNPRTGGHVNFFPFDPQPLQFRNGMIKHEDKRLRDLIHAARERHPDVVAQLNHARYNLELSGDLPRGYQDIIENGQYLDHMGVANHPYNPSKPLGHGHNKSLIEVDPQTGLRDIDFDAMELMNPSEKFHEERTQALRKDWLSFLKQGERITGTANSDSHHENEQVAVPRNMVAVQGDSIASFNQDQLLASTKSGNLYGTTGPMLEVSLSGVPMGGTFQGAASELSVTVQSADWIPMETIIVQFNGEQIAKENIQQKSEFTFPIEVKEDGFITVEVIGPATPDYTAVYPHITPYAFSNPIYIDYNKDGQWQAPGL